MSEVLLITSSKDTEGIAIYDVITGSSIGPQFKNCMCDPNTITLIGKSISSYSGAGSCGDYIIASQSKKPVFHIWQWSKPQVLMQCHIQEILVSICTDPSGCYIFGGSRKGWLYIWDITSGELIRSFHGHYKSVNKLLIDCTSMYLISGSEDGMIRVWDIASIIDNIDNAISFGKKSISPYRSWNAHTLAVKDFLIIGSIAVKRVYSCSLDKTLAIHDIISGKLIIRIPLTYSLECLTTNLIQDFLFLGSSVGKIFIIDISIQAINITTAHNTIIQNNVIINQSIKLPDYSLTNSFPVLEGHEKAVTSMCFSSDGLTLISASQDGSIRYWNAWTRQCIKEFKPFKGVALTNVIVSKKSELFGNLSMKPILHPMEHLSKYSTENKSISNTMTLSSFYTIKHDILINSNIDVIDISQSKSSDLNNSELLTNDFIYLANDSVDIQMNKNDESFVPISINTNNTNIQKNLKKNKSDIAVAAISIDRHEKKQRTFNMLLDSHNSSNSKSIKDNDDSNNNNCNDDNNSNSCDKSIEDKDNNSLDIITTISSNNNENQTLKKKLRLKPIKHKK